MNIREQRVVNSFINCVKQRQFSKEYAYLLLEDTQKYGYLSNEAKQFLTEALENKEVESIFDYSLEGQKELRIQESKKLLAKYIEEHPITSSAHGAPALYSVTEEKQNMLSRKFSAHVMFTQAGIPDQMTWNAMGQPCENWTDIQIIQLMSEINAYVTPLVSKQQHYEVEINACETIEELEAINIFYGKNEVQESVIEEGNITETETEDLPIE